MAKIYLCWSIRIFFLYLHPSVAIVAEYSGTLPKLKKIAFIIAHFFK